MDANCGYMPIGAYVGACFSSGQSQCGPASDPASVCHLSSKASAAKNAKNGNGPVRVGRRKDQRPPFHSAMAAASSSTGAPLPAQVQRRNERERNRVRQLNSGFSTLREHVPNGAKNKKMSKVETLRCALEYIAEMKALLATHDPDFASSPQFPMPAGPTGTSSGSMESPISEADDSEQDFGAADSYGDFSANFGHLVFPHDSSPVSASDFVKSEEDFPWI